MYKSIIFIGDYTELYHLFEAHPRIKHFYDNAHLIQNMCVIDEYVKSGIINEEWVIIHPYKENSGELKMLKLITKPSLPKLMYVPDVYKFSGFWPDCNYYPYPLYKHQRPGKDTVLYKFDKCGGIHVSFLNSWYNSVEKIKEHLCNMEADKYEHRVLSIFEKELENAPWLEFSEINLKHFFQENYKTKKLWLGPNRPSLHLFYEIFRQLVFILFGVPANQFYNGYANSIKVIHRAEYSNPILPVVKEILNLQFETSNIGKKVWIFDCSQPLFMSVEEFYYVRLNFKNFENFLKIK